MRIRDWSSDVCSSELQARREAADPRFTRDEHRAMEVLGLEGKSDRSALRRRYSELVRKYHPDRNGGDRSNETRIGEVGAAYQLLRKRRVFAQGEGQDRKSVG